MISPLVYIGGKNRAAARILPLIPKHTCYTEPFFGAGQLFFRKAKSDVEVINDLSRDVVTFFRICQNHYEELVRYMRFMVVSRGWYDLLQRTDPETLTDVQRAARLHFLLKTSYAGRVVKQNFRYSSSQTPNFRPDKIPEALEATHKRLVGVQIECLPYEKILEKYDRSTSFHFLDPPYWERKLYQFNFTAEDFRSLAARLQKIKGKFLMTLDDHPEIRKIFGNFEIRPFDDLQLAAEAGPPLSGAVYLELPPPFSICMKLGVTDRDHHFPSICSCKSTRPIPSSSVLSGYSLRCGILRFPAGVPSGSPALACNSDTR